MNIFKSDQEMPPKSPDPGSVRTAQTKAEVYENLMPATVKNLDGSVHNIERPRRGHDY